MEYRNHSRLVLAIASWGFGAVALITGLGFVAFRRNAEGFTVPVSPVAAVAFGVFALAFVITATGWLVLRGVNYDTWYRQTHPGQPLHAPNTAEDVDAAAWQAADRTPGA